MMTSATLRHVHADISSSNGASRVLFERPQNSCRHAASTRCGARAARSTRTKKTLRIVRHVLRACLKKTPLPSSARLKNYSPPPPPPPLSSPAHAAPRCPARCHRPYASPCPPPFDRDIAPARYLFSRRLSARQSADAPRCTYHILFELASSYFVVAQRVHAESDTIAFLPLPFVYTRMVSPTPPASRPARRPARRPPSAWHTQNKHLRQGCRSRRETMPAGRIATLRRSTAPSHGCFHAAAISNEYRRCRVTAAYATTKYANHCSLFAPGPAQRRHPGREIRGQSSATTPRQRRRRWRRKRAPENSDEMPQP